jgi:hypothetical protein
MTITTTDVSSGPYAGTGATGQQFVVDFQSAGEDEIEVQLDGIVVDPSAYTFDREADGTGTVTATLDGEVMIFSKPNFLQGADFQRFGPYFPDDINPHLDRAAQRDLYLKDRVDRALVVPFGETVPELPDPDAAGFLAWNPLTGAFYWSSGTGADDGLRADAAASGGASLIGFISADAGAAARSVQSKLRDLPHAFDFIPAALHNAIELGINVDDLSGYIQDGLDTGKVLALPAKGLLWTASPLDVPSGGGLIGGGYGSVIKAKADFGNVPLIRNAVRYPPGANTAARLLNRDKGLYFGNFRVDGNKANNTTATEFSAAFWLAAVDGAHFENVVAQNPKGDGLTLLYATDGVSTDHAVGCSNTTGFIRTENCARQGVAPVCAEGCDLSIYDIAAALFSLDPETDQAANYVRNNYFRLVSIGAGNGTVASGGIGVGGQNGDVHDNVIDFAIFNSAGSGVVWRNTQRLILRGTINGAALSGLTGIDTGANPSTVTFDVDVRDVAGVGFGTNETAGSEYNGSIRISGGADAGGATITGAAGGKLHMRIEDHTGQGLILTDTTNMVFPDLFVGNGSSHSVWFLGASSGNRFPNLRSGTSAFGSGFLEAGTSNDNRATNARIGAAVTLIGAASLVEFEMLKGSAVFDPGSIADGDMVQTTFAIAGASLGDAVEGSFSLALGGLALSFEVSAANTVRATFLNNTGAAVDLGSGTLRAFVTPRV